MAPIFWGQICGGRSPWPCGLRGRSSASRPLRLWVWIPLGAWMFVCCECCVLSGRGLCDGLITRPEESYRLWRVVVCDLETSKIRRLKPPTGLWKIQPQWVVMPRKQTNKQICGDVKLNVYIWMHVACCHQMGEYVQEPPAWGRQTTCFEPWVIFVLWRREWTWMKE